MSGFVYKWIDSSNDMYYIGSHKGSPSDDYVGSGIHFSRAYSKRPKAFSREIIYNGVDYRELEEFILQEMDAANDSMSYNLKNSAIGGHMGEEGIEKMRKKRKGTILSEETKRKMSQSKTKYSLYCEANGKTYKSATEAADDLGYTHLHIRAMSNKKDKAKNHLGLIRIKKIS